MVARPDDLIPTRFSGEDVPEELDELEDMIESGEQEVIVYPPALVGWEITSVQQAEAVMRRLRRLVVRQRETIVQAQAWREPIEEWERDQLKRITPGIEFYARQLEVFGKRHRGEFPKEKTIRLPSGDIATKQGTAPVAEVVDEDTVVDVLAAVLDTERYGETVKTVESVRLKEFRALVRCVEVEAPWCQQCGERLQEWAPDCHLPRTPTDARWTHLDPDVDADHAARPVMEWAVVFGEGDAEVRVTGAAVKLPEITAVAKPHS